MYFWFFFLTLQTTVKLAVPKTALVSGFCDEERSYLVLRYKEGEANRAVVFYLRHKGSQTLLENIETIIKLDSAKFPRAKLANGKNWNFFSCHFEVNIFWRSSYFFSQ